MLPFLTNKLSAALAPMAGCTDSAFRRLCRKHGASCTVSEMISAKALTMGDKKSFALMKFTEAERPFGIQLFGSDPGCFSEAAAAAAELKPDFIDINMGCPAPKITGGGAGSALMRDIPLAGRIVSAAAKASGPIPVTVKMRAGFDSVCCCEAAQAVEQAGASALFLHPRTRAQMFTGHSDWPLIALVKGRVSIPVIGNGDIRSGGDAARMLLETGCDGVMVGRAALGNPFIFEQITAALSGEAAVLPALDARLDALTEQVAEMCRQKGELRAMPEARKHIMWSIGGFHGAAEYRRRASMLSTFEQYLAFVRDVKGAAGNF